jgi:hypothetical protein
MHSTKKSMSEDNAELEQQYNEIVALYDQAQELADTVQFSFDPDGHFAIIEPVIDQVEESADILTEEFITVLQDPKQVKKSRTRIEKALRGIFTALHEYQRTMTQRGGQMTEALVHITDSIAHKIKLQTEKIIGIIMAFVDISLDRIMQKAEVEELRRRDERIAAMMHYQAMQSMNHG